ncbi:MAG: DUF4244 domain-containing protein [Ilumatobacteraceae bacterium]
MSHRLTHTTARWTALAHSRALHLEQQLERLLSTAASNWRDEEGQATTEYALVLLGAALVALLLVAWASSGGTAGKIGRLFDRVIDSIIKKL